MSTFQVVVLGIFASLILIGVGVFSAFGGVFGTKSVGPVVIWGTLDTNAVAGTIEALRTSDKSFDDVSYVQKDAATYEATLVNAMASGAGPDLFLLSDQNLSFFKNKILLIPYNIIPQGSFLAAYVDAGQLFLSSQGIYALPFTIDPLVMYWNRDLFASAGIATPPQYWNDFLDLAPKITSVDARSNVKKSAVDLGEWRNIPDAKGVLAALFMQAGDPIIGTDNAGNSQVVLGTTPDGATTNPAESALRFYTEFANPAKTSYSWNRSLPSAPDMFTSGDLGVYLGYASEYGALTARNPNLRFSIAPLPQIEGNATRVTYARISGIAIARTATNVQGAVTIAQKLTSAAGVSLIAGALSLPPVRRDVSVDTSANAGAGVLMQSSLISRSWLDLGAVQTDQIFQAMIESVVSGKLPPAGAVGQGAESLRQLLPTK
jgi:multiple sugar transport system substrate-binding protein